MSISPLSWSSVELEELGDWGSGGTPKRTNPAYFDNGSIPWLVIGDLNDDVVTEASTFITNTGLASSSAKLVPVETLLVAMYGSIGKLGITGIPCATNQAIAYCKPDKAVASLKYLFYALLNSRADLAALGQGGAQQNISQGILKAHRIPLAPLAEQKRIADKLDALLARVDACRERLDRIPALLKRFRQSVLAAATSGELTEEWRADRPMGWAYERATDVCAKVQSGGTPKQGFTDIPGIPFLKVYNIVEQKVAFEYRPQFVKEEVHGGSLSKSITHPGDVLMNIVGPPLGKVAVVPDSFPEWNINQAITLFRPSDRVTTAWLYCVLCGGENIADIVHETRGSAGQTNISLTQCREFIFPVPPMDEQTEIVRRVEALFALADRIEARYQAARAQVERLTPALLAKAFRGELVPQDPNDEPASVLLARVRSRREAQAKPARKVKGSRKPGK